jgi:DNA polymerase I-like protein with 3'-5' exonuclease and polymerase domains
MSVVFQRPLFQPESAWRPPRVGDLPSWAGAKRVAVDTETCDPLLKILGPGVRRGGYIVGYSFAVEDGPAHYVPLRHAGGDNVEDPVQGLAYLRDQAKAFAGDLCGANLGYDLDYMAEVGIAWPCVKRFRDCQIAEPLLDELQDHYSLEAIAKRRHLPGKDETLLREASLAWHIDAKQEMWKLPARFVGAYGEQDVRLPLQLLRRQEREIEEQDLSEIYDLECRLLPVLVRMRRRGVRIDFDRLAKVEEWSERTETELLQYIYQETGVRVAVGDVWKAAVLAPVLQKIGVEVPTTAKGQFSIDKNLFASIKHPVAKAMERARKVNKIRTTFAKSIRDHAIGDRIHCTFNQLRKTDDTTDEDNGARYGRVSCVDPNLQQQPCRITDTDDFCKIWRVIYVPDRGGKWAGADFSQQEPRWVVHFAEAAGCAGATVAGDAYRNDPTTDNHTMMARIIWGEEPDKKRRTQAKIIFLGIIYGMGGGKLAHQLGLPTKWIRNRSGKLIEVAGPEAQSILDQVDRQAPFLRKLAELVERKAKHRGYVKTILGRRCRFPVGKDPRTGREGYIWTHKALNRIIQGSSGDQTKLAMVLADEANHPLQLQVHDELCETVYEMRQAEELADIMRTCVPAKVPFKVDVEVGPNWGEAH